MKKLLSALLVLSLLFVMASCSDEVKEYSLNFDQDGTTLNITCLYGGEEVPAVIEYSTDGGKTYSLGSKLDVSNVGLVSARAYFAEDYVATGMEYLCFDSHKVDTTLFPEVVTKATIEAFLKENVKVQYAKLVYELAPENLRADFTEAVDADVEGGEAIIDLSKIDYTALDTTNTFTTLETAKRTFSVNLDDVAKKYGRSSITASIVQLKNNDDYYPITVASYNTNNNYPGLKLLSTDILAFGDEGNSPSRILKLEVKVTCGSVNGTFTQNIILFGDLPKAPVAE